VVVQPSRGAHRGGMDSLVLAAAVPTGQVGKVADFGAGCGTVGLAVLARCPAATALLVERDADMLHCARLSLARPENAGLSPRADLLAADVGLAGAQRLSAGLATRSVQFVVMNPPFNDPRDRATPSALRRTAHVAAEGLFESWLRTAAAMLTPGGSVALIARPASLRPILDAAARRFGSVQLLPVHARADAAAIRIVLRARLGSRGPAELLPALVLQTPDGRPTARADEIVNGRASLFGD
jgi:tRNA1(Val) A37 N6-methylase TrmN6